jgi:hypothetical protein
MMVEIPNKAPSRVYLTVWEELQGRKPDCEGDPIKKPRTARKMLVTKKAAFAWKPDWAKDTKEERYSLSRGHYNKVVKAPPAKQTVVSYELSRAVSLTEEAPRE